MLTTFINILTRHDPDTAAHSARVSYYAALIAEGMSRDSRLIQRVRDAAYLHDIGKSLVPESLLNKTTPLTADQRDTIESHVHNGFTLLNRFDQFTGIAEIVLSHHEKYDGTGYPSGLHYRDIPLESRIIAVADSFDAITSDRTYQHAASPEIAFREIDRQAGMMFDPEVVRHFLRIVAVGRNNPVADTSLIPSWKTAPVAATLRGSTLRPRRCHKFDTGGAGHD